MITSLYIRNLALIETLQMDFESGMHVLSGETGAGKSIIVDAVNLVLGGRSDRDLIRSGTERASVEAAFTLHGNTAAREWLSRNDMEADDPVTLYREITTHGRNLCRIQGTPVSLSMLRDFSALLMDVHGQHEARFLMDSAYHLQFLDEFGDGVHAELLQATRVSCERFLDCHHRYSRLARENERKTYRMEEIRKDLEELRKAKLIPGEEEKLQKELEKLRQSGKIVSAIRGAYGLISAGEEESILTRLKQARDLLKGISGIDPHYAQLSGTVESAYYELEEAGYELASLMETGEFDPQRQEKVETRLELIKRMEKKYGPTVQAVLERMNGLQDEYDHFLALEEELTEVQKEHRKLLTEYRKNALALSENRKQLAAEFEHSIMRELSDLGMAKTSFKVCFDPPKRKQLPQPEGDDVVSFMMSANPGEPLKPLSRIASGGELSRIMLALKSLEAEHGGVDCMVFDEIDTGISGRMAQTVAEKMSRIAATHQVLCVTHLPQIAAMADHEFLVEKHEADGRTVTAVHMLSMEERVSEVARMLGGADGEGDSAKAHARHMLDTARNYRQKQTADSLQ